MTEEKQKKKLISLSLSDYVKIEGLPFASQFQLIKIIIAIGFFFAGFNLSLYFNTVLLKEYFCSPQVYNCIVGSTTDPNRTTATSMFNNLRSLYTIIYMVALIVGGAISDDIRTRFGNRVPMILTGAFISGISFIIAPFIITKSLLLITGSFVFIIMGIGFGMSISPLYALISELFKKEERGWAGLGLAAFGTVGTVIGLGFSIILVEPLIDTPGEINWNLIWVMTGIAIIILGFLTFLFTPRLNPPFKPDGIIEDILNTPTYLFKMGQGNQTNRDFFLMFLVTMIWGGAGFLIANNLPGFIGDLRAFDKVEFDPGSFLMVLGIAGALFAAPSGIIISKLGNTKGGMVASLLFAGFTLLMTQSFLWSVGGIIFLGLLGGFSSILITTLAVSLPADLVPRGKEGQFMGLFSVAANIFGPILGFSAGFILEYSDNILDGYSIIFWLTAILYVLAFFILGYIHYEDYVEEEYQQFYLRFLSFKGFIAKKIEEITK